MQDSVDELSALVKQQQQSNKKMWRTGAHVHHHQAETPNLTGMKWAVVEQSRQSVDLNRQWSGKSA